MADEEVEMEELMIDEEGSLLSSYVVSAFTKSQDARYDQEKRWIDSYKNYRGIYGNDNQFTDTEKSQVFIKVTKTKVMAAYGQITDVLFAGQKFPLGINSTRMPKGIDESINFDPLAPKENAQSPYGFPGDGNDLPAGATNSILRDRLEKDLPNLQEGPGLTPTAITYHPADEAAKKMEKI